jgi:hypothetical protein
VAVKQVRVSDLSGKQADEDDFGQLIVHEQPQYQGPITLDVLPDEIGELPESEEYVSIEIIQPGERRGQRALLSVERFNQLAARGDMNSILMNAVGEQRAQEAPRRRRRSHLEVKPQAGGKVDYASPEHAGEPHRGRVSPEEAAYVRDHLDEVQRRLGAKGMRLLDPDDPKVRERYRL